MSEPADLIFLTAADVTELLGPDEAIASQRRAFSELGNGRARLAPKVAIDGAKGAVALNYTARLSEDNAPVGKFLSVNPANVERDLPLIHALITVLDPETGRPTAVMDGTSVTTARTSAGTAVAVDALASEGSRTCVIVGTGVQSRGHGRALGRVRTFDRVIIAGRNRDAAAAVADELGAEIGGETIATTDVEAAVREGDVVVLCTTSMEPVIDWDWVRPGATVVSIGSFAHDRHEVAADALGRADIVVVDDVQTNEEHGGPVIEALASGVIDQASLVPLAAVIAGHHPGRTSDEQTIFYNSVGIAVQDAAAAETVLARALEVGAGTRVLL
ncbi:ornithine cyclodeaminase family protein [Actinomycetota bacterium]